MDDISAVGVGWLIVVFNTRGSVLTVPSRTTVLFVFISISEVDFGFSVFDSVCRSNGGLVLGIVGFIDLDIGSVGVSCLLRCMTVYVAVFASSVVATAKVFGSWLVSAKRLCLIVATVVASFPMCTDVLSGCEGVIW